MMSRTSTATNKSSHLKSNAATPPHHCAAKKRTTQVRIPAGEPDLEALRSVTREWLAPRLVDKFLRMHGVELTHSQRNSDGSSRMSRKC